MLGVQAVRTIQKCREEKKKIARSSSELQGERFQRAAREDEEKFLEELEHLHLEDSRVASELAEETKRIKQKRHFSVQNTPLRSPSLDDSDVPREMMKNKKRSMDSVDVKEASGDKKISCSGFFSSFSSARNSRQSSKKPPKRRMSTFT
ncbi:hypothetical protein X798_03406 [Onchocerca flexuosa]|uniref:Uncharacterized protein n=1 Tax=Onchocerca flexuosa TaxID=387005 RepID=A0A238BXK1_9BILA|nr:hypothetical protein X798_03406 [Onchocerca flexuosa]